MSPARPRQHAARSLPFALAALLSISAAAAPAAAQSPADVAAARELFVEGSRLAQEGKWDAARDR